jgi:trimethylamine--corrinoid protein Co-methyltransferase
MISDWRNFPQWQAAGSPTADRKANVVWKQAMAEYVQPDMDPAIGDEIDAFVARRTEEGGEPTDF